jgi:predicted GNAT family acetyltransferase
MVKRESGHGGTLQRDYYDPTLPLKCDGAKKATRKVNMPNDVRDNKARSRFELDLEDHVAFSEYRRADGVLTVMHTEVPAALNGKGIGSRLVRGLLDLARAEGAKVRPRCPFVKGYIDKHPEYSDLLA